MGTHDEAARPTDDEQLPAGTGDGGDRHAGDDDRPAPLTLPGGEEVDVAALMALAERLAHAAGELALTASRAADVTVARTKSSAVDVVTEVDEAAEALLRAEIAAARPEDAVLGEEEGTTAGTSGLTWVVDPIDGTVNFVYGLPHWSVSVAVVAGDPTPGEWTLLAGCVYAPALGRTWTAGRGLGAFADGRRLQLGAPPPLAESLVGTGFSYSQTTRASQGRQVAGLLPLVRDIRRLGSAAVDLCLVAEGGLDVHYEESLNAWDMAAGALVLAEAGGVVRGLGEDPPGPVMTVGAHPDLAATFVRELERVRDGLDGEPTTPV